MFREIRNAVAACLVTFAPLLGRLSGGRLGRGLAGLPPPGGGSLIERDGKVIGSELIAQPFVSDKYIHPRPSAVDYKADAAGGSNLGDQNPDLHTKVAERANALKATPENLAPTDLVTASGGGLDPDISLEAARYQAARVATARGLPVERVLALIDQQTVRSGAIIGAPPRINVLRLNLALDAEKPASLSDSPSGKSSLVPAVATARHTGE